MSKLISANRVVKFLRRWRWVTISLFAAFAFYSVILAPNQEVSDLADRIENLFFDYRFEVRGEVPADPGIEMVGIDSTSFEIQQHDLSDEDLEYEDYTLELFTPNWPWDREVFARTLTKLIEEGGAKMVVFDFLFGANVSAEGDQIFKDAIKKHSDKVVMVAMMNEQHLETGETRVSIAMPNDSVIPDDVEDVTGLSNVIKDDDDIIRKAFISDVLLEWHLKSNGHPVDPKVAAKTPDDLFSLTAMAALKVNPELKLPSRFETRFINYAGEKSSFPMVPLEDLFLKDRWESTVPGAINGGEKFKDKIVIVGPYAEIMLKDYHGTPFGIMAGPEIQANQLATILNENYIRRLSERKNMTLSVGLLILTLIGALKFNHALNKASYILVVGVFYAVISQYFFEHKNLLVPVSGAVVSVMIVGSFSLFYDFMLEQYEKSRINNMFGTYLSPELVSTMVASGEEPQLGGEDTEITAFFSDVQGFSGFSEKLTPQQLVDLMNEYLTAMTDILLDYGCYVDKYIGDAIVGIFNAPLPLEDHALKGCIASMHQHRKLSELRAKWLSEGDKWPPIVAVMQARLGMNTGHATVGNMGSRNRFNYTMMGDTVNLAARCESGAKAYGVYSMITGETKEAASASGDDCVFRYLDKIIVKGRSIPAEMYEIVCLKEDLNPEIEQCLEVYNKAMDHYLKQEWNRAHKFFEEASKLEPNRPELNDQAPTTPSVVMMERTKNMQANPPDKDWDGVYVMTTK